MNQSSCFSLRQNFSPNQDFQQVKPACYSLNTSRHKRPSSYPLGNVLRIKNASTKKPETLQKCRSIASSQEYPLSDDLNVHVKDSTSFFSAFSKNLYAFYLFTRPHTIIGTIIGIASVSILPIQGVSDLSPAFFIGLLKAIVPSVLMNVYVVGLNQIYDVEIDKINKPDLPLASGVFSMGTGIAIVSSCLAMSLVMGVQFQSPALLFALIVSCFLGSVYSIELPLLRWKRHAFLAATCIFIVRAVIVQLAFFVHMQKYVLGRSVTITKSLVFGVAFMCFFTTVIALFKDIPDVEGDKYFGIQSFSVSLGKERVFWLCVNMLLTAYGAAVVMGASSSLVPHKLVTVGGHLALASFLLIRARSIDLSSKASITAFYMFIWKLFYGEYFLIPFIC